MTHPHSFFIQKYKYLETEMRNRVTMEGFYNLKLVKADTGRLVRELSFPNVICNSGFDGLKGFNRCYIGYGTNPPSITDTALGNATAVTYVTTDGSSEFINTGVAVSPAAPDYAYSECIVYPSFKAGVGTGNITEIGMGTEGDGLIPSSLWSRSLIVDGSGNPISITKLADEVLHVTYTVRIYIDTADLLYDLNITGSGTHAIVQRPAYIGTWGFRVPAWGNDVGSSVLPSTAVGPGATLGPITGTITGGEPASLPGVGAANAYVPGSYSSSATKTVGIADGNLAGGIAAFLRYDPKFGFGGMNFAHRSVQMTVTPPIMKDNTKVLTLNSSFSWARHTP